MSTFNSTAIKAAQSIKGAKLPKQITNDPESEAMEDPAVKFVVQFCAYRFDNPKTYTDKNGVERKSVIVLARELGGALQDLDPERFTSVEFRKTFYAELIAVGLVKKAWAGRVMGLAIADNRYQGSSGGGLGDGMAEFLAKFKQAEGIK